MRRFDIDGIERLAAESLQDIAPMRSLRQMMARAPRAPAKRAIMASKRAEQLQPQLDDELMKHIAGVAESVRSQRAERGPNRPSAVVEPPKKPAARTPPQTFDVKDPAPLLEESAKDYLPRAAKPLIKKPELPEVEWFGEPLKKHTTPLDAMKGKGRRSSSSVGAGAGDAPPVIDLDELVGEAMARLSADKVGKVSDVEGRALLRAFVDGNEDDLKKMRERPELDALYDTFFSGDITKKIDELRKQKVDLEKKNTLVIANRELTNARKRLTNAKNSGKPQDRLDTLERIVKIREELRDRARSGMTESEYDAAYRELTSRQATGSGDSSTPKLGAESGHMRGATPVAADLPETKENE